MVLHTVNKSPSSHTALRDCLEVCGERDALVLLEDGVYGALAKTVATDELKRLCEAGLAVYALETDLQLRGLSNRTANFIKLIDYEEFVQLVADANATQSWF